MSNQDTAQKGPQLACPPGPMEAEGGQPYELLHPKEGPSHVGNLEPRPLLNHDEAARLGPLGTNTFPGGSLSLSRRRWA